MAWWIAEQQSIHLLQPEFCVAGTLGTYNTKCNNPFEFYILQYVQNVAFKLMKRE